MALILIKKILLFLCSLIFIILLLGATVSYSKDEFEISTIEDNFRFYSIEWIDVEDENKRKYVCGTKVSTFDNSARKFILEYYYILTNENKIVTRFDLNAIQMSFDKIEPLVTRDLEIKLHGTLIIKNEKEILGGPNDDTSEHKGITLQFSKVDFNEYKVWI